MHDSRMDTVTLELRRDIYVAGHALRKGSYSGLRFEAAHRATKSRPNAGFSLGTATR
jgi:hypothetical protein